MPISDWLSSAVFVRLKLPQRARFRVAQEELAAEVEVPLHRLRELGVYRAGGDLLLVLAEEVLEDPVQRVGFHVPLPEHERLARGDVQFHAGHAGAVLAPVVLLLHQEEELCEPPERRAVLLLVIGQGLEEPHQGDPAFV